MFTEFLRRQMLTEAFGGPTYVGFFLDGDELADSGYARQPVQFGAVQDGEDDSFIANSVDVLFPVAAQRWRVDAWGLFDDDGNLLEYTEFGTPQVVAEARDQAICRSGDLVVRLA